MVDFTFQWELKCGAKNSFLLSYSIGLQLQIQLCTLSSIAMTNGLYKYTCVYICYYINSNVQNYSFVMTCTD